MTTDSDHPSPDDCTCGVAWGTAEGPCVCEPRPEPDGYFGEHSHPGCSPEGGHTCAEPSGRTCTETGCDQPAGTRWGPYWCPDHDAQRLDRITTQMSALSGKLAGP